MWNDDIDFHAVGDAPRGAPGDVLTASDLVEAAESVELGSAYGQVTEAYVVPDGLDGLSLTTLAAPSKLVRAVANAGHGSASPVIDVATNFGTGGNAGGANGADAGEDEYGARIEAIANGVVNFVVLRGQDARRIGSVLIRHLKSTEEPDLKRIAVIGAPGVEITDLYGHSVAEGRLVIVRPRTRNPDGSTLPPVYTAAAAAGLVAAPSVQTIGGRLTNISISASGDVHAFHEIGRRCPTHLRPGIPRVSGTARMAHVDGALLRLLFGDGSVSPPSGSSSHRRRSTRSRC